MGNIFRETCRATMLRSKLSWFVARVTTFLCSKFLCCKSRRGFYFLYHENLLRKKVLIRATNHLDMKSNIVARQVARKMLPVLLGINQASSREPAPG